MALALVAAALQNDDAAVAEHALLRLWAALDEGGGTEIVECITAWPARAWRRLGLLLFASDPVTVRTVISVIVAVAAYRPLQQRIWTTEWRQYVVDKLFDCHARGDTDVALRLVLVIRSIFQEALASAMTTLRDQALIVDVFVALATSPLDAVACVAVQALHPLVRSEGSQPPRLDPSVRAYLQASTLFGDLVSWVLTSLSTPKVPKAPLRSRRRRMVLEFLVDAARESVDVAQAIAQHQSLLTLVLDLAERRSAQQDADDVAHALQLLVIVLQLDNAQELASTMRRGGALITLSWLLGHACETVRTAASDVVDRVVAHSNAGDMVRALMEQGCVLIYYLMVSDTDAAAPCRRRLDWLVHQLGARDDAIVDTMAATLRQSTNVKLQRNVLLALLLLHQSIDLDDVDMVHILHDAVHRTEDGATLATTLLATALLCCDKSSTLRVGTSVRRLCDVANEAPAPSHHDISLVCAAGERVVVDAAAWASHCNVSTLELHDYDATTVALLAWILPLSPELAARELARVEPHRTVEKLVSLAKTVECTKGWHAASLALSNGLDKTNWKAAMESAVRLRHPALLLRAIRAAAATTNADANELQDAAVTVWTQLITKK